MQVFIIINKPYVFNISSTNTILELKEKINNKFNLYNNLYTLRHHMKILDNNKKISFYNINKNTNIYLMRKLLS